MADLKSLDNLNELIGYECTYNFEAFAGHYSEVRCRVKGFIYILEEAFPYGLIILIKILPLNFNDVTENMLDMMQDGVGIDEVVFI